jgi:hypothetical protein
MIGIYKINLQVNELGPGIAEIRGIPEANTNTILMCMGNP